MTTRRALLATHLSFASAAAMPRLAFAQVTGRTARVKAKDGIDPCVKDTAKATAAAIAGSKLIAYEGASHGIVVTERDRVTKDLQTFLAS